MTRRLKRAVILAVPTLPILVAACGRDAARAASRVPLYDDLGTLHREVTTTVPLAQRYFDQGLRLVYGFNHEEAVNSFQEAIRCRAGKRARGARRRSVLRAAASQCQGFYSFYLLRAQPALPTATVDERFRRSWLRADVTLLQLVRRLPVDPVPIWLIFRPLTRGPSGWARRLLL